MVKKSNPVIVEDTSTDNNTNTTLASASLIENAQKDGISDQEIEVTAEQIIIDIAGNLTISTVRELYDELQKALDGVTPITLAAENAGRVDGAVLQVLLLFWRQAQEMERPVKWQNPSEQLLSAAAMLGVATELGLSTVTNGS